MSPDDAGDPFAAAPARAPWMVTLADLALLLLGFLVLVQATADREAVARSLRDRFGTAEAAVPVAATAVDFAPGSADPAALVLAVDWARAALADPRVAVTITGSTAPGEGDVLLAADRARAVTAALTQAGLPPARLRIATTDAAGRRVTLTLAFAGEDRSHR